MRGSIGLGVLAAILAGCATSPTPVISPASSNALGGTPVTVPTRTPESASPSPTSGAWAQVSLGGGALASANCTAGVCVDSVRAWAAGFVAVGSDNGMPMAWTSADGRLWQSAEPPPAPTDGIRVEMFDVIAGGPGLIAVGTETGGNPCSASGPVELASTGEAAIRAIVWTTADGLHWTRVPDGHPFDLAAMTRLVGIGSTFVALGAATHACVNRGMTWTSTDGRGWTPHVVSAFTVGGPTDAIGQGGRLVAVGQSGCPTSAGCSGAAWTSSDGIAWTKGAGKIAGSYGLTSVTATPGGFLAAGSDGQTTQGRFWTSTDGVSWGGPAATLPGSLGQLEPVSNGYVAAGDSAIWASTDGSTWTDVTHGSLTTHTQFSLVAHGPSATIVFGILDDGTLVEWAGPP
jgi:hypothetical protein